ncbi:protein FAM117B-like isoform X1 [Bradysia coprophila]|uniref:protein FAM117B-like isoform X1 n=1 Tax=Bradysia coprophila TaxID=38358 RepID=UPI00187DAF6D|nr:protein FAM117B-like isoform X1 [Bradysia coprophila]
MSSRVDLPHKMGPIKATIPISSLLRGPISSGTSGSNLFMALSPPMRHISPEYSGHRSPGALNTKGKPKSIDSCMRRTASLDALYLRPSWSISASCTILQVDKSTQTEESFLDRSKGIGGHLDVSTDLKIEKVIRQRLQKTQRGEHSVSSQTLSPIHATPVLIPPRQIPPHTRPMRSSVEGLNQEIEKLVLNPCQQHTCRPETNLFSRGTPEGHRAPIADLLHGDATRSVNTQTPNRDLLSDDSQSTSPEDGSTGASPRINRFLAREPPDGCEKVCLKPTDADPTSTKMFKPCVGFLLRPSLGSAFQPIAAMSPIAIDSGEEDNSIETQ